MKVKNITVIGLGLIGGSLGRALVAQGYEVTAVDRDENVLARGLELRAATRVTSNLIDGVRDAQVVFVAVPVGSVSSILTAVADQLQPGTIVSDVGSVKSGILQLARDLLPPEIDFIGGHPMAGSEQNGIDGADPLLFINAYYVLTPGSNCSHSTVEIITGLVRELGAFPIIMDAAVHDRAAATLSHLPHLLAVALAQTAGILEEFHPGSINLAAGSFRDGTRVVESSPIMWQDICVANRSMILESLQTFRRTLDKLEEAVQEGDSHTIGVAFNQAVQVRQAAKDKFKGKEIVELVVSIPDSPGALGNLAQALGRANINIASIEILHSREGLPGSVVLGFPDRESAAGALQVISSSNIPVQQR